jgi:hypothetical protein
VSNRVDQDMLLHGVEEHDQILVVCFLGGATTQQKGLCQFQSGYLLAVLPMQDSQALVNPELPLVSPNGDLAQRKVDYWRINEVKNLKKIANPQACTVL